jgi:hypothetical protein
VGGAEPVDARGDLSNGRDVDFPADRRVQNIWPVNLRARRASRAEAARAPPQPPSMPVSSGWRALLLQAGKAVPAI